MKKIFTALMCITGLLIITACGGGSGYNKSTDTGIGTKVKTKATGKVPIAVMETISVEKDNILSNREGLLQKTDTIAGFILVKPQGSEIKECLTFTGEGELKNRLCSYMVWFVCGEDDISADYFDGYAQALWEKSKAVADDGKVFETSKDQECSSVLDAQSNYSKGSSKVGHCFRWYYNIKGVKRKVEVEPEFNRNKADDRVENGIKVDVERILKP